MGLIVAKFALGIPISGGMHDWQAAIRLGIRRVEKRRRCRILWQWSVKGHGDRSKGGFK